MGYSIYHDWSEYDENLRNHGRDILEDSCKHYDQDKNSNKDNRETNIRYSGYCEKCGVSEDTAIPIYNYLYPLELKDFDKEKILKVVKETNCTVIENEETGEWFLTLCGCGMDLSQDIAYAYVILETIIPRDLLVSVCKQPLLSLGKKQYEYLAKEIISQLENNAINDKNWADEWKNSLKSLKRKNNPENKI